MVSKFEEVLIKFDNSTKLLDKISEECQKYANLLLVNSKQSDDCTTCCNEMIADVKQVRLLLKKLSYNKEQLVAIRAKENASSETTNKRERTVNRKTRTSSMKYLVQWEKVMEAQLAENAPQNQEEDEEPPLLPKPVIKRRIRQFENKDTKRVSSTAEFFLDESDEIPESYGEAIKEEDEDDDDDYDELEEVAHDVNNSVSKSDSFKPRIVDVVVSKSRNSRAINNLLHFSINCKYPMKKQYE